MSKHRRTSWPEEYYGGRTGGGGEVGREGIHADDAIDPAEERPRAAGRGQTADASCARPDIRGRGEIEQSGETQQALRYRLPLRHRIFLTTACGESINGNDGARRATQKLLRPALILGRGEDLQGLILQVEAIQERHLPHDPGLGEFACAGPAEAPLESDAPIKGGDYLGPHIGREDLVIHFRGGPYGEAVRIAAEQSVKVRIAIKQPNRLFEDHARDGAVLPRLPEVANEGSVDQAIAQTAADDDAQVSRAATHASAPLRMRRTASVTRFAGMSSRHERRRHWRNRGVLAQTGQPLERRQVVVGCPHTAGLVGPKSATAGVDTAAAR